MANSSSDLNILGALAVVEWVDDDGQKRFLPGIRTGISATPPVRGELTFDLTFETSSNSAFCKLNIPFVSTLRPKEAVPLSLLIPPERVITMDTERPGDALPEDVSRQLGKEVVRLQFNMKSPADLVVPQDSLTPKNRAYALNLRVMSLLAQTTTITLYLASLSEEQLLPLCDAVSHSSIRSIENAVDLPTMYLGKGGRIADTLILTQASLHDGNDSSPYKDIRSAYSGLAFASGQAGSSGKWQQGSTSGPSTDTLPSYHALQPSVQGHQYDAPKKRRRPSSATDVEEDHIRVFRKIVVEMYGGLGQEVESVKEELRATKQELHETKEKMHETQQEIHGAREELRTIKQEVHEAKQQLGAIKQDVHETKEKLHEVKQELHESQRITTQVIHLSTEQNSNRVEAIHQRQDGVVGTLRATVDTLTNLAKEVVSMVDRVKTEVTKDLVNYIDESHAFDLTDETVDWLIDSAMHRLDVYTQHEVDERLNEVQEHCEGLNSLETEEMVLGAKSELEEDVRNEIKDARLDLGKWVQDKVSRKMRRMTEAVEDKLQAAKDQVMEVVRMEMRRMMRGRRCHNRHSLAAFGIAAFGRTYQRQLKTALVRVQDLRAPPRLRSDTSSTASTASA